MTELLPGISTTELPPDPLLVIEVTEADIWDGTPGDTNNCAIAYSLGRLGFREASVGTALYWRDLDGRSCWAILPAEASIFISEFDSWGESLGCEGDSCEGCCGCGARKSPPNPVTFSVEVLHVEPPS